MHMTPRLRARPLHPDDPRLRIPTYLRRGRRIPGINAPMPRTIPLSSGNDA